MAGTRLPGEEGSPCTASSSPSAWTREDYPRSFAFDPTGEFLYCCNQRADNVTTFRVDRKTGGLSFTGQYTPVGNPSCGVFLDRKMKD
jgi:6-phosphogluconolactonase (cycloisomerase 2 family)